VEPRPAVAEHRERYRHEGSGEGEVRGAKAAAHELREACICALEAGVERRGESPEQPAALAYGVPACVQQPHAHELVIRGEMNGQREEQERQQG